ncbi:MAG: hypothetical protein ABI785_14230 [Gemmatimonadales bacterium]
MPCPASTATRSRTGRSGAAPGEEAVVARAGRIAFVALAGVPAQWSAAGRERGLGAKLGEE